MRVVAVFVNSACPRRRRFVDRVAALSDDVVYPLSMNKAFRAERGVFDATVVIQFCFTGMYLSNGKRLHDALAMKFLNITLGTLFYTSAE